MSSKSTKPSGQIKTEGALGAPSLIEVCRTGYAPSLVMMNSGFISKLL